MCFEKLINDSKMTIKNYGDFNKFYNILEKFEFNTDRFNSFKKRNKDIIENNKNEYNYSKIKIFENSIYDIYVIFWIGKTNVAFHDHSQNGCYYKVLDGMIEETIVNNNNNKNNINITKKLKGGDIGYIHNDIGLHKMNNIKYLLDSNDVVSSSNDVVSSSNEDVSVSIHIYSPPNYICNKFDY
jgi:hypothetical protein